MNSNYSFQNEYEMDLKDVIWKLLAQWKAVLLVCIMMALIVSGAKYAKDLKIYDANMEKAAEMEQEQVSLSADERIEKILENIPAEDAATILFIVKQQELLDQYNDYLKNSIWVNTDPTSQHNLGIKYRIHRTDDIDMQMLCDSYSTCMKREEMMKVLQKAISPDAPLEAIYELVSMYNGTIADSDIDSVVYTINIVLPDDVNTDDVISAVDSNINTINKELKDSYGAHTIKRFNYENTYVVNTNVSDKRVNVLYGINNLTNNINNAKTRVSEGNKAVIDEVIAIKQQTEKADEAAEEITNVKPAKPSLSKKYAVLGFIIGAILYAGAYFVIRVIRKTLGSARVAQDISGKRLLGEIYLEGEHKGLGKLFSSHKINELRLKNKLNTETQAKSVASTIESLCNYHKLSSISLLTSGVSDEFNEVIDRIAKGKIKTTIINTDSIDEKALSDISNAVYLLSDKTKVNIVKNMLALCKEYDVRSLGTVYLEEV